MQRVWFIAVDEVNRPIKDGLLDRVNKYGMNRLELPDSSIQIGAKIPIRQYKRDSENTEIISTYEVVNVATSIRIPPERRKDLDFAIVEAAQVYLRKIDP